MEVVIDFRTFYFDKNVGHGNARRKGLSECSNNLVALMDSDDISAPYRFEKQLRCFLEYPSLSIVGGQISEFVGDPDQIIGIREVPEKDNDIRKYMKKRCPMNQVTVMMKKDEVERAGGYIDWYCEEDYYLWARMALAGCTFHNVPETLVNVRVGNEMSARRGGMKYFKSEARMQRFMKENGLISTFRYLYNVILRFAGEVIAPDSVRTKLFCLFRKNAKCIKEEDNVLEAIGEKKCAGYKNEKYPPFSVSICVYGGDNAEWFDAALDSVINQTIKPQEIVLVVDGPVPNAIQEVIEKYSSICNRGGGIAQGY